MSHFDSVSASSIEIKLHISIGDKNEQLSLLEQKINNERLKSYLKKWVILTRGTSSVNIITFELYFKTSHSLWKSIE